MPRNGGAHPTLVRVGDVVADHLRADILSGRLQPGARLNVAEIAARFSISRTPVDDGLRRLEAEGLVVITPRRGTFVAEIDTRDLEEIFDIRIAIEQLAVATAVKRMEPADLGRLRHKVEELRVAGVDGDVQRHSRANADFHEYLVSLSQNRRLAILYGELYAQTVIARVHGAIDAWRSRAEQELGEHIMIIDALEARDALRAQESVEHHLRRGLASLIADLRVRAGASNATEEVVDANP